MCVRVSFQVRVWSWMGWEVDVRVGVGAGASVVSGTGMVVGGV